jgi:hypothetical protein
MCYLLFIIGGCGILLVCCHPSKPSYHSGAIIFQALADEGLNSSEIDDYVVETAGETPKKQAKRGSVTPSKTKGLY